MDELNKIESLVKENINNNKMNKKFTYRTPRRRTTQLKI